MTVKTLIIDDERLARKRVVSLLGKFPEIEILGECGNGQDAISKIHSLKPNLIFLDIQMKDMNGFEVLSKVKSKSRPIVIFVTAYDEFAIQAFKVHALDYLLKPYENSRFAESVAKAIEYFRRENLSKFDVQLSRLLNHVENNAGSKPNFNHRFPVKIGNKINFIDQDQIKYVLASGSYPEIHTIHRIIPLRDSLTNLMGHLDTSKFIRVHRSVIVNTYFITELIQSSYHELDIKMEDNKLFRVSKSYRKNVIHKLGLR